MDQDYKLDEISVAEISEDKIAYEVIDESEEVIAVADDSAVGIADDLAEAMSEMSEDEREEMVDEFIRNNPEAFEMFKSSLLAKPEKTRKSLYTKKQVTRADIKAKRKKNKKNKRKGRK